MAKRVSPDERPFNPVQEALTRSVLIPEEALTRSVSMPEAEVTPVANPSPAPSPRVVSIDAHRNTPPSSPSIAEPDVEANDEEQAPEKLTREKRYLLTETEEDVLERLVKDVGKKLGTPLKLSHVIRATVSLLIHSRDELLKQSERVGKLKRPPNNDPAALATFEHNLARILDRAIRGSRILD